MEPITFHASLPPISSAIKADGSGGYRIQLDIPEEDYMEVYKVDRLKGQVFMVSISPPVEKKTESIVSEEEL